MGIFAGIPGWFRYFRSGGGNGLPAPKPGALPTGPHPGAEYELYTILRENATGKREMDAKPEK